MHTSNRISGHKQSKCASKKTAVKLIFNYFLLVLRFLWSSVAVLVRLSLYGIFQAIASGNVRAEFASVVSKWNGTLRSTSPVSKPAATVHPISPALYRQLTRSVHHDSDNDSASGEYDTDAASGMLLRAVCTVCCCCCVFFYYARVQVITVTVCYITLTTWLARVHYIIRTCTATCTCTFMYVSVRQCSRK